MEQKTGPRADIIQQTGEKSGPALARSLSRRLSLSAYGGSSEPFALACRSDMERGRSSVPQPLSMSLDLADAGNGEDEGQEADGVQSGRQSKDGAV